MNLSIIIPAYKCENFLEESIRFICNAVKKYENDFEVLIVVGDCPDKTLKIAKDISKENFRAVIVESSERLGKGKALSLGFAKALGEIQIYLDADLDVGVDYILSVVKKIKQGNDVVIVSKYDPMSNFKTSFLRTLFGKAYNVLINVLFKGKIYDYQGGMKGFTKKAIKEILPLVKDEWWFWDTEVLLIARYRGFGIIEIPIVGVGGCKGSTVNIFTGVNLLKSIFCFKKRQVR